MGAALKLCEDLELRELAAAPPQLRLVASNDNSTPDPARTAKSASRANLRLVEDLTPAETETRFKEASSSEFTGKEEDVEVGLQYFGKRYLNPLLGRWVSADPLEIHAVGNSGEFNVYAYVSGQVLKNTDPFGLCGADEPCSSETGGESVDVNESSDTSVSTEENQSSYLEQPKEGATRIAGSADDGVTVSAGMSGRYASKGAIDVEGTLNLHFTRDSSGITISLEVDFNVGLNIAAGADGYTWEVSAKGEGGAVPKGKGAYVKGSYDDVDDKDGAIIDGVSTSGTYYVDEGSSEFSGAAGHDFGQVGSSLHLDTDLSEHSAGIDVGSGNASVSFDGNFGLNSSGVPAGRLKGATLTLGDGQIQGGSVRTGGNMVFSTPSFKVPQMLLKLEAYAGEKLR